MSRFREPSNHESIPPIKPAHDFTVKRPKKSTHWLWRAAHVAHPGKRKERRFLRCGFYELITFESSSLVAARDATTDLAAAYCFPGGE